MDGVPLRRIDWPSDREADARGLLATLTDQIEAHAAAGLTIAPAEAREITRHMHAALAALGITSPALPSLGTTYPRIRPRDARAAAFDLDVLAKAAALGAAVKPAELQRLAVRFYAAVEDLEDRAAGGSA